MFRKFYKTLSEWESAPFHKPIMVTGARQVGKTWLIRHFCENTYKNYIYINLEERPDIASIFDGRLDPNAILTQLSQMLGRVISSDTPIFIDEIQRNERAITALKYFCEAPEDYRILCAGSLLGVKLERFETSFPVGKVCIHQMYPMDFEEFMIACDETLLRDGIRNAFLNRTHLAEGIHEKVLHLYHDYLFTGGMPECILDYLHKDKKVLNLDSLIHKNLQLAYLADMTKYVTSAAESVKITEVYNTVPRQLANENPKFKYSTVRSGGNKRDFSGPLDWLVSSGMVYRVNALERPEAPLKGYEKPTSFKIYMSDVGILTAMCGFHYRDLLSSQHNIYKGGITENYVIQQFASSGHELYYYKPSESMEIDLIYDDGYQIVPIEIKSGRHKRSTSLKNYMEKFHPAYGIRFSELNFGWSDHLYSIPLYAAFCVCDPES